MYESTGILEYNDDYTRLVLRIDQAIADYYLSLIPKYRNVIRQRHDAHITIVRSGRDIIVNKECWKKYDKSIIKYYYDGIIRHGKIYYWMDAYSVELEDIRLELGLELYNFDDKVSEYRKRFHFTIGNVK